MMLRQQLNSNKNKQDKASETNTEEVIICRNESLNTIENGVLVILEGLKQVSSVDDGVLCLEKPNPAGSGSNEKEKIEEVISEIEIAETKPEKVSVQELNQELISSSETELKEQNLGRESENFKKEILKCLVNIIYKCRTCSEVLYSKESQEQHKCSTPYRCQICMKVLTNEKELCSHMLCHKKEPCRICGKSFKDKSYYLAHVRAHSGIGYKCTDCGKVFATSALCNTHRRKHTGEKPYICEFCGKKFGLILSYQVHLKQHNGEKPFECPICLKRFAIKTYLQYHILTHTGERPHVCEFCGKSYREPGALWNHWKYAHGQKHKNCKCPSCPKEYLTNSHLKVHMRTHTGERPYECHLCGKKFANRQCLTTHIRIHGGQTYPCTACNKSFSTLSAKGRHMRTHTGETPYGCATCDKAFSLRRDLVKHVFKFQH